LFCDRAAAVNDGFALGPDNVDAVAQICGRLDGIPLAIELAAARVRMMTPGEIADRLDERFRLLTGGARTAVERHQTLRQTVDWSYELLAPRERVLLNRLGVFAGGFTLDAAESVAAGGELESFDVLDGLGQLVDKSLVVADATRLGTRYRLLETIRQYALERLDNAGETDATRRRHAEWFADFVSRASAGMRGPDESVWWGRFQVDFDNIRAALVWATGTDDADLALSFFGNFLYWSLHSRRLGYLLTPWAAAALATTGAAEHPRFVSVLAMQAIDHLNHQRNDDAEQDARRALKLMARPGAAFSVYPWSALCQALTQTGRAEDVAGVESFVKSARATGDDETLADALNSVALLAYTLGDTERCITSAEEALRLAQRIGNPTLLSVSNAWAGGALRNVDPSRAEVALEAALEYGNAGEALSITGTVLAWLAMLKPMTSQQAEQYRQTIELMHEVGDTHLLLMYVDVYAQALATTDRAETAALLRAAINQLAPHMTNPISVTHRGEIDARLLAELGEERFAELTAQGATLDYDQTLALTFAELDRIIASEHDG
jgi:tetratricopeptide (TPR) repeat protein